MSAPATGKARVDWVDYAKGIAIFMVVALHALHGLLSAGIPHEPWVERVRGGWELFSFNMPVFFFLAGLFIVRSARKPAAQFVADRFRGMVYPYVLWSLISLIVGTFTVTYTNSGLALSPETLARLLYDPILHYWFLYGMFINLMVFLAVVKLGLKLRWYYALVGLLFILVEVADTQTKAFSYVFWRTANFTVYFALGVAFSQQVRDSIANASSRTLTLISVVGLLIWGAFVFSGPDTLPVIQPIISGIGTLAVISVSGLLARHHAAGHIQYLGLASLEIYLAHVIAAAGVRIILVNIFNLDNMLILFVVVTLAGVYLPLLLKWITERIGFPYLFEIPRPQRSPVPEAAPAVGD